MPLRRVRKLWLISFADWSDASDRHMDKTSLDRRLKRHSYMSNSKRTSR